MAIPLLAYYAICALLASTILHVSLTLIEYGVPFSLPSLDTIHIARLSYPFRRLIGQGCQNIPAKQDMSPLELVLTLVLVAYLGPVMNRVIWALASFSFSVVSRPIHTILVISFALFRAFRALARSTARHRRFLIPLFIGGLVAMVKFRLSDERQPLVSPSLISLVVLGKDTIHYAQSPLLLNVFSQSFGFVTASGHRFSLPARRSTGRPSDRSCS
ncbi:hypothetical protein B0H11DRAFT_2110178 [Mycena galericulata]|nr:hypothetical protein B0H11DRAFT_2110178 [Mycena galericulata]